MKTLIAFLCGVSLCTIYAFTQFSFEPTGTYSEENIERIRQGIPKPYKISAPVRQLDHAKIAEEVACLSKNVYFEARSESAESQLAVALVTLNRVHSRDYPNELCDVVYEGIHRNGVPVRHQCKFSWYCDGKSDRISSNVVEQRAWANIQAMSEAFVKGCLHGEGTCPVDITRGALYYYNPDEASRTPSFAIEYTFVVQIESHKFYKRN